MGEERDEEPSADDPDDASTPDTDATERGDDPESEGESATDTNGDGTTEPEESSTSTPDDETVPGDAPMPDVIGEESIAEDGDGNKESADADEPADDSNDSPPPQPDPGDTVAGTGPGNEGRKEFLLETAPEERETDDEEDADDEYDLDTEEESGETVSGDTTAEEELTPDFDRPAPGYDTEGAMGGTAYGPEGPTEDQEMPLTVHLEEMIKRLAVVVAIAGIVSLATFPFAERIINFLWYSILPGTEIARPRLYGILELKLTELKTASLAGLIVALPVFVYQTYRFMRPGLYPHERRYYLAAVPTSLILALIGVAFAFFIVLPGIFTYFLYYSQDVAQIGFALGRTFDLILLLMGYLALVFQIPLFVMLAIMMGLTTREWLAERRLLIWGSFLGISFIFSPDPTGMAPIVIALTMVVLFEGTLLLVRWTDRRSKASGA